MPPFYWKRVNPGRILNPSFAESDFVSDDLKDLAGVLLRRARALTTSSGNLRDTVMVFRKLSAWLQALRCHDLLQGVPASSEQYARLSAEAREWERAYDAVPLDDAWWEELSRSRMRRAGGTKEAAAQPPTSVNPLTPVPPTTLATPGPRMSPAGTPMGDAHRDTVATPVPADPVWGDDDA